MLLNTSSVCLLLQITVKRNSTFCGKVIQIDTFENPISLFYKSLLYNVYITCMRSRVPAYIYFIQNVISVVYVLSIRTYCACHLVVTVRTIISHVLYSYLFL